MRLKSVQITNYKCIEDSTSFSIHDLTCLAGKNESGKTAILQALYRLNPVENSETSFDVTMEYPRPRLTEYQETGEPSKVLSTVWELDPEEIQHLEAEFGSDCLTQPTIVLSKRYGSSSQQWAIRLDERKVIENLLKRHKATDNTRKRLRKLSSIKKLYKSCASATNPTKAEKAIATQVASYRDNSAVLQAIDLLSDLVPRFVYFPDYERLPGRVAINEITKQMEEPNSTPSHEHRLFLALLDQVGTNLKELQETRLSEQLNARLEAYANRISRDIFRYWSQNQNLKVRFNYQPGLPDDDPPFNAGYVFQIRIENTRHWVTVRFDERSSGFIWFFSFLVWFSQAQKTYGKRLILLLDEPGLNLHGTAQADLLRYFKERLAPQFQVIYTTHSPFMIDVDHLSGVRTVEDTSTPDGHVSGTKVSAQILSADADTLFPLRAALGYDITQSLFIGEHCLLVEGPSDLLYLAWASSELLSQNRTALDNRWTITPVGGIDKVGSFAALFGGNKLHVAVFTDFRRGVKNKVRSIRDQDYLRAGHVLSADMFVDYEEADIEDLLGRPFYLELVNDCYSLSSKNKLKVGLKGSKGPVLEDVATHFKTLPTTVPEFNHYSPASHLIKYREDVISTFAGVAEALDRFEELFKALNELLSL